MILLSKKNPCLLGFDISGHIVTVPAYNSGTMTYVLPHKNATPQTQDLCDTPTRHSIQT